MIDSVVKYIKSLRFTLLIISLLGVMFLLGLWIPQERIVSPEMLAKWQLSSPQVVATLQWLGFLNIYTSPTMLGLWAFFFLNLSLVMWQRLPLLKKRIAISESRIADPATASGYSFRASFPLPADLDAATLVARLRRNRYAVLGDGAGFFAVKNRLSPIAFALFHLSFFLVLVGGLTSVYTKFVGVLEVAEGETFQGEVERYVPTPSLAKVGSPPRVAFTVQSVVPQSVNGTATGLKVKLQDARGEQLADVNRPYHDDHTTFVVDNVGPAPLFVVTDPQGKELDGAFMKLHVMGGAADVFSLAGYHFRAHFYPDYALGKNGKPETRSREFKNPRFVIAVEHQGKPVTTGTLAAGDSLAFDNYKLVLRQMPLWVRFSVIKEQGLSIIYAGFAVASIAVIWRFLFYRRELMGVVREEEGERRLVVAGRSEFYKTLAEDEFRELIEKIIDTGGRKEQ